MSNVYLKSTIGVVFSILMLLSGCGKKNMVDNRITFLMWGSAKEKQQMDSWLKRFYQENPEIGVKCISISRNYNNKVLTMFAGGTPPDVMMVGISGLGHIYSFASKGILLPLDEFIDDKANKEWKEDIYVAALDRFKWKGHYWGIPREVGPSVLYYNRDLFDKMRIPYPDDTWDWPKLIEVAKKMRIIENGRVVQYGILEIPVQTYAFCYGSEIIDESGRYVFGSPEDKVAVEAYKLVLRLIDERIIPSPISKTSFGWGGEPFLAGRIGMFTSGPWTCMALAKKGTPFKWDMALIPKGKRRSCSLGVYGYAISKHADRKEDCFKLIKFLTSPEIEKDIAFSGRSFPASKKASEFWLKDQVFNAVEHKEVQAKALANCAGMKMYVFFNQSVLTEVGDFWNRENEKIFLKKISVEEGLKNMYEKTNLIGEKK